MANPAALQDKEQTRQLDRWLRSQAKTVKRPLNTAVMLGSVNGFLLIAQCWMLAQVLNATAIGHQPITTVWGYLAGMIGLFLLRAGVNYGGQRFTFEAGARLRTELRARLFDHIHALGPAWSRNQRSGARATEVVDGVEALDKYFSLYLPQMQLAIIIPAAILIFVFPFDWISGLVLAITAPLLPVFMIIIGNQTEKLNRAQWRSLSRMGAHFFDMIEGLTTLKLFNAAQREARFIGQIAEDYRLQTMKVLRVAFLSSMVLEFLAAISIAMVAVYVGFRLMYGDIHYLNGIFVLLLAPEFYLPLRSMGTQFHARMDALGAVEPIIELLNTKPSTQPTGEIELQLEHTPRITFSRLNFAYPNRDAVIRGLNLDLPAGTHTALIGASGAGKSTVGQLLLGFLTPTDGEILINDTPLTKISPRSWHKRVAWLPQNPTLFHGTIEDNIALNRRSNGHVDALHQAAQNAHALDFINRLPNGFQTIVGDRGQGLSGGEIQRIALARAFYKDAPVVLLDEPSASLDPESEHLITDAIARLSSGRTMLTIAHRLTTIERSDQIVVLDGGKIIEQGAHEALLHANGAYAERYRQYRSTGL
ncbi:MAG: thiol reductant ABC exporter subunit CydD [Halothiobacillus sp.]|jgi:ATP-binding cassette subfamily C protein CydD|nr:thiol reductant ABC exporter subunit CydD [Halothiobacillus sp.]